MRVLALNCGSSSLKFQLQDVSLGVETFLLKGKIALGTESAFEVMLSDGVFFQEKARLTDHTAAVDFLWGKIAEIRGMDRESIEAVGHRIVHGGNEYIEPAVIDERMILSLHANVPLASLHNEASLKVVEKTREDLGEGIPMVAVFDTAFHQTIPEYARRYALPEGLVQKYNLWRHGFHGLAHRWMSERYAEVAEHPATAAKLITIQLGSGCSMAAVSNGRSVETSMGLTPLGGLVMGTRCGDIDPLLPYILAEEEGYNRSELEECLYRKSGLLGVSGSSGDVKNLIEAERRFNLSAKLALDLFCYRVRQYVGAYLAVLGGADAIIFGGGIGENEPVIRSRICRGMDWCGLRIAEQRNKDLAGREGCISELGSSLPVYVIPVEEETLIARDCFQCLVPSLGTYQNEYHVV